VLRRKDETREKVQEDDAAGRGQEAATTAINRSQESLYFWQ